MFKLEKKEKQTSTKALTNGCCTHGAYDIYFRIINI